MHPKLIDSHAHLTSPELIPDLPLILKRAQEASVEKIINICTDKASLLKGLEVAKERPGVFNVGATTPHDVDKEGEELFPLFEQKALSSELVAVGETGLDYYHYSSTKECQIRFFVRYLHLAIRANLPVVIHCRDAFEDLFAITALEYKGPLLLHCFTGTEKEASIALDRGWKISFSGIITFKKSEALRQVVKEVPLSSLLIETDAPFLTPQTKRGRINEPSFLVETAECLANLKGISYEELAHATFENTCSFFRL